MGRRWREEGVVRVSGGHTNTTLPAAETANGGRVICQSVAELNNIYLSQRTSLMARFRSLLLKADYMYILKMPSRVYKKERFAFFVALDKE